MLFRGDVTRHNCVLVITCAAVAASASTFLAFQFTALVLPAILRISESPFRWCFPVVAAVFIILGGMRRRSRKSPRSVPQL